MRVRLILTAIAAIASANLGCEPPESQFVSSDRTNSLMRKARDTVKKTVDDSFGNPQDLVAWMKLPAEFGEYQGKVQVAGSSLSGLKVELTPTAGTASTVGNAGTESIGSLKGAGILWLSGPYKDAKYEKKGQELPVVFRVSNYDAETGQLSVTSIPRLASGTEGALSEGDTFVIVGEKLQNGRKHYMRHCMHCHGVTGDGNGKTAPYLNPRPRDYRLGIFKFTSTKATSKARRDDLKRIVKKGIPGTYMPSFVLLDAAELDAIIEYIRWLALRGELENQIAGQMEVDFSKKRLEGDEDKTEIDEELDEFISEDLSELFIELADDLGDSWTAPEKDDSLLLPQLARTDPHVDHESIARGKKLFLGAKVKCLSCHGPTGRGNGPSNDDYNNIPGTQTKADKPGLFDQWGNVIKPRDLTSGIYRGGRRPIDIYRRIAGGIKGTPMQSFGKTLKDNEIWDLVNYVMYIPFERRAASSSHGAKKAVASHGN